MVPKPTIAKKKTKLLIINKQTIDKKFFAKKLPSRLAMATILSMAFTFEKSVNLLARLSHKSREFFNAEAERLELMSVH